MSFLTELERYGYNPACANLGDKDIEEVYETSRVRQGQKFESNFAPEAKTLNRRTVMARRVKIQNVYKLRVSLNEFEPQIWRTLAVPAEITLDKLHEVLQIVMGWSNCHMHMFRSGSQDAKSSPQKLTKRLQQGNLEGIFLDMVTRERCFVKKVTPWGETTDMEGEDEAITTLAEVCPKVGSKLTYEYDFGDGWEHAVEVETIFAPKPGVEYPVCLVGEKACPPEDCGGAWGYGDLLETIEDPKSDDYENIIEWLGGEFDHNAFDIDEVNHNLAEWRNGTWRGH